MRQLTLILSDLYLPADAEGAMPASPLPQLERLLSIAGTRRIAHDWRWTLAARVGAFGQQRLAASAIAAFGRIPEASASSCWLATAVNYEARLDHVRLTPKGILALPPEERAIWCADFAQAFGPELALHDAGPRAFLLTGLRAVTAQTRDPALLLGSDIALGLSSGPDAGVLRKLSAEIEMWAHGHALNREREKRGQPVVSGLWFWGRNEPASAGAGIAERATEMIFAGEDAFLSGLSRKLTGREPEVVPDSLRSFVPAVAHRAGHLVVELLPMTSRQSLDHLDEHWFGPAVHELGKGGLDQISIFANQRLFQVSRRDRLAFWRRRHPWIDSLRRAARTPEA